MLDNLAMVEEEKTSPLNPKRFRECWDLFVADGQPLMRKELVPEFMEHLGAPLGVSIVAPHSVRLRRLLTLEVPVRLRMFVSFCGLFELVMTY